MAKSKTLIKGNLRGDPPTTDFTFKEVNSADIRFNRAAVLKASFNSTSKKLTASVIDEISGKVYSGEVTLTEEA